MYNCIIYSDFFFLITWTLLICTLGFYVTFKVVQINAYCIFKFQHVAMINCLMEELIMMSFD